MQLSEGLQLIKKTRNHAGNQKSDHISRHDRQVHPLFTSFSKILLLTTRRVTGTTDKTFQQSEKQDSFRHKLMSSASIYESSGSQFFRITTGIQSGSDAFDNSSLAMVS